MGRRGIVGFVSVLAASIGLHSPAAGAEALSPGGADRRGASVVTRIVSGPDMNVDGEIDLAVEAGGRLISLYRIEMTLTGAGRPPHAVIVRISLDMEILDVQKSNPSDETWIEPLTTPFAGVVWRPAGSSSSIEISLQTAIRGDGMSAPFECGALNLHRGVEIAESGAGRAGTVAAAGPLCVAAARDLNGGGIDYTGNGDEDGDGLTDYQEACLIAAGHPCLRPCDPDSDGDGLDDKLESEHGCLDPCNPDTDVDGLDDALEYHDGCLDPCSPDTDGDGLDDAMEYHHVCLDPCALDTDGDGLIDGNEFIAGCLDPCSPDTDGDALGDGFEYGNADFPCLDPCAPDSDCDGLSDGDEYRSGCLNPCSPDTDGDGMDDGFDREPCVYNEPEADG